MALQSIWNNVDAYLCELFPDDPNLSDVLKANAEAGLPAIDVSPTQGKFLNLLVKMCGAKRILEIGTLGGYSTLWMAKALPSDGMITTLEYEQFHADVAHKNIERAGYSQLVEIFVGAALDTLPSLEGPYDFIFIDADKPNNPQYLEWALKLSKPGTIIIGDNIVREGAVTDADSMDEKVIGVRRFLDMISKNPRLEATALQTVGSKGYDGFVIVRVLG